MRQVTIRELQVNPTQEFKDLPFEVTRYGKSIAVIMSASHYKKNLENIKKLEKLENLRKKVTSTPKPENQFRERPIGHFELCKHGRPPNLCSDHRCRGT